MSSPQKRVISEQEARQLAAAGPRRQQPQPQTPQPVRRPRAPIDIRQTKKYKSLYRKWVSTIVALPILFYTSWELYQRVYAGKTQKHLIDKTKRTVKDEKRNGV
ncbi:uncharacterized protein TRUGW13939_00756 [Talaromyces rugulosus]|uniref:Uncharacterized protein n=1 Tax=Talaromyces rugulosus TaxID=121627 RepID=A0A7H8QIF7_TALRU|nr:uncharacterized protein TRUGW13939_00756 [Talaromyces rugulosus]QKX53676.1 hypothetical protein TRUGW13939_00756 [Talaromyces rugulosus]